jgi:hypothetical protein
MTSTPPPRNAPVARLRVDEIIKKYCKSVINDPSWYSGYESYGRDAITAYDINNLYLGIKNEINENAARNFMQMLADMPSKSATSLLLGLHNLSKINWQWSLSGHKKNSSLIPGQKHDGSIDMPGLITQISFMLMESDDADDNCYNSIGVFLSAHKGEYVRKISSDFAMMAKHRGTRDLGNGKSEPIPLHEDMSFRMTLKEINHQYGKLAVEAFQKATEGMDTPEEITYVLANLEENEWLPALDNNK